jgi:polysaccharide export outer membrane protein
MSGIYRCHSPLKALLAVLLCVAMGCQAVRMPREPIAPERSAADRGIPVEGYKTSLPPYVIEPPDILLIDAVKVVPKAPHAIEPFDLLQIIVDGTLAQFPIANNYPVEPGGTVNLGGPYGRVKVSGLTIEEATAAIDKHLRLQLKDPQVSVSLAQSAGIQQIIGEHLVGPDGTVNLGTYGKVYVTGLTIEAATAAIEERLSEKLEDPKVAVDVFAYNSKVYYIIIEGAGGGDQVIRIPITGNETVLDAIAQLGGMSQVSSQTLWIARPTPGDAGTVTKLPINWKDITRHASMATNYQILPGDRVFIMEDRLTATDRFIAKLLTPFERIFGFSLLGIQTIQTANRFPLGFSQRGF